MQLNYGFATDIGRKRQQNQDNGLALPELGLFVVSDGMGGHSGGETASAIAVETLSSSVRTLLQQDNWKPRRVMAEAIQSANHAIYEHAFEHPELHGMGTTTTALLFTDQTLTIGHVGDSRCYYLKPNAIWQLTRDHSLVQEKLRAGLISRAQLKTDKMKNVITRSVGFEPDVSVDTYELTLQTGDVFLICSDGLSGGVDDEQILEVIQTHLFKGGDIKKAVYELIQTANNNGGEDNITVILIQVMGPSRE